MTVVASKLILLNGTSICQQWEHYLGYRNWPDIIFDKKIQELVVFFYWNKKMLSLLYKSFY